MGTGLGPALGEGDDEGRENDLMGQRVCLGMNECSRFLWEEKGGIII